MSSGNDQVVVECPHCRTPLAITVTPPHAPDTPAPPEARPVVPVAPVGREISPPPIGEVLEALYPPPRRRQIDPATAHRGAAAARQRLRLARAAEAERKPRSEQARTGHLDPGA